MKSLFFILPVILLLLVSCTRRSQEPTIKFGNEETLAGSARLDCLEECRQRGQCGQINTGWVVLMSSTGPATTNHDLFFPVNSEVTILQNQGALVESIADPEENWREIFYEVTMPERGTGWVAGWCIMQEIVP